MGVIRTAAQSGRFYPANPEEIIKMINHWEWILEQSDLKSKEIIPESIIAPHAGYIYSGFTANTVHRLLPLKKPETVVVMGPSHYVHIPGFSMGYFNGYETPFGIARGDVKLAKHLAGNFEFVFEPLAHEKEHSTETQFPFITYYNPGAKILEMIYGAISPQELEKIIAFLLKIPSIALVVSTDLSHFHTQEKAYSLDKYCLNGVEHQRVELLESGCEACGKTGLEALTLSAIANNFKTQVLDYSTSGDVTGDYSSVVGYMSAVVYK